MKSMHYELTTFVEWRLPDGTIDDALVRVSEHPSLEKLAESLAEQFKTKPGEGWHVESYVVNLVETTVEVTRLNFQLSPKYVVE